MTKQSPYPWYEKNRVQIEVIANIIAILTAIFGGLIAIIESYRKLTIGNRSTVTLLLAIVGSLIILGVLCWVGFSRRLPANSPKPKNKRDNLQKKTNQPYRYSYNFIAKIAVVPYNNLCCWSLYISPTTGTRQKNSSAIGSL